jgi:hypothetical protein
MGPSLEVQTSTTLPDALMASARSVSVSFWVSGSIVLWSSITSNRITLGRRLLR